MKNTRFNRLAALLLAFVLIFSALFCLYGINTSASGTTPDLVTFNTKSSENWAALKYIKGWSTLKAGNYRATVNLKLISGDMPRVKIGHEINADNADFIENYQAYFDASNELYIITFSLPSDWKGNLGWYIGNYGKITNFAVANPCLYLLDSSGNPTGNSLINTFASDYYYNERKGDKWVTVGCASPLVTFSSIPSDYFTVAEPQESEPDINENSKMLYISFNKAGTAYVPYLFSKLKLSSDTEYIFEFDWKAYAGAIAFGKIEYYDNSSSDYKQLIPKAQPQNTVDGISKTDFIYDKSAYFNRGNFGHTKVLVKTPSKLDASASTNARIGFYTYLNDDAFNNARGGLYFANARVYKKGTTNNLVINSDFGEATEGNINSNFPTAGWEKGVDDSLYESLRFVKQPRNFFTSNGANAEKVLKFNGGNWDYIDQYLYLEANTNYRLSYKVSYRNGKGTFFVKNYNSSNTLDDVIKLSGNFDYKTSTYTYDFKTSSELRTIHENAVIRFTIPYNGIDVSYYLGNIRLYKLNGSVTVGANLINNGSFTAGETKTITDIANKMNSDGTISDVELTGFKLSGNFTKNGSIEFADIDENTFPEVLPVSDRLTRIADICIGRKAESGNPFEDINHDGKVDIIDLCLTKKAAVDLGGSNSDADIAEQRFKNMYVNGDNETDFNKLINYNDGTSMLANPVSGTVYYVSSSLGNDQNSGTSPDKPWKTLSKANSVTKSGSAVLFKCGDTWRRENPRKPALVTNDGVTYGAYGSGKKPKINGSLYNFAEKGYNGNSGTAVWTNAGTNIWKTAIKESGKSVSSPDSVGLILFDSTVFGTMKKTKAELQSEGDYFNQEYTGNDGGDGYVYLYCKQNPANRWNDIEITQKSPVVELDGDNITINNLCIVLGGEHGISGGALSNIAISNCEVNYIGGSYNSGVRFGNGIQFGQGGSNLRIKNCYVSNVFDAAITFQSWGTAVKNWLDVYFTDNLLTDSFMGIEWFAQDDSVVKNIYLEGNIIRNMGGWCYNQRIGTPGQIGTLWCASIKCGQRAYYKNVSNFNIKNNVFDRSNGALIYWWFNENGVLSENRLTQPGLNISGNSFYQDNADCRDGKLMNFDNQTGVTGWGTGALREAVMIFDKNPKKVKFIYLDDRIIY